MEEEINVQQYLKSKIHPIFERLVIDLLLVKPDDPIEYMVKWLQDKGQQFSLKKQKDQYSLLQQNTLRTIQNQKKPKNEEIISSDEDNDEEEEDFVDELKIKAAQQKIKKGRSSVSAEVYGAFNKKQAFKPRVIPKKPEQKERLVKKLSQVFMFQALDDKEREIVISAMEEKKFKKGDWVIKQGDDGNELYIVESGELDCFKKFKADSQEQTHLKTYITGDSFGELSLLYNTPRGASIRVKTDSAILWALDRDTFNNIVKDASIKKREKYDEFLKSVKILQSMDPYERSKIADALKSYKCQKGEYVVKQGEQGDIFFMVEEGELVALKTVEIGKDPEEVMNYKKGDYFGELALLENQPRQASIFCRTDCQLVALDRYSFKRLLGPIDQILKRNKEMYQNKKL